MVCVLWVVDGSVEVVVGLVGALVVVGAGVVVGVVVVLAVLVEGVTPGGKGRTLPGSSFLLCCSGIHSK
jgi:hypothetical protein